MDHKNYSCYRLARTLEKKEWHQFVRDVKGGARTRHKGIQALVAVLASHYPTFEVQDSDLIEALQDKLELSVPQLRVLRSKLKDLLEGMVVEESLAARPNLRDTLLIQGLIGREATALAQNYQEKSASRLSGDLVDLHSIEHDYRLSDIGLDLYTRDRQRSKGINWHQLLGKLDALALAHKLSLLCAMLSERAFLSEIEGAELKAVEDGLWAVKTFGPERNPLVNIYFHLLSVIAGHDAELHAPKLRQAMQVYGSKMERIERVNIFGLQINYFLAADRKGAKGALVQVFSIYKQMVEEELLFGMGIFSINSARNILSIGGRLGESDWTWTFLEEAKRQLPEEESEKFYLYGSAYLNFADGKYGEAKKMLVMANSKDPFYKLAHDGLLLRICYEAGDTDLFYAVHASLGRHLYRKEGISKGYRTGLQNLLKLIEPMFEMRGVQVNSDELTRLRELVGSCDVLANRDWVENQLKELELRLGQ